MNPAIYQTTNMKKHLLSIAAVTGLLAWGLPLGGSKQASADVESASDTVVVYVMKAAGRG